MSRSFLPLLVLLAAAPLSARAADDPTGGCLECHGDSSMTFDMAGGETLPLYLDEAAYQKSVHGQALMCKACHPGKGNDHATGELAVKTRHELARATSEACKHCHDEPAEGIHHAVIERGNPGAPACSECHGAHDVMSPDAFRTHVPAKCGSCHGKEAAAFAASVHGSAVDTNDDVPVCTDCHGVHKNADTSPGALSLRTPVTCGRCHTDEKRMKKYGISTRVVDTYLSDFHGMVSTLQRGTERGQGVKLAAGCTDCHGVHDIQKTSDPRSRVIAANLQKTCQGCHEGAPGMFPQAWLSHWDPSPKKAPAVWAVRQFYRLLIPFMIGGLVLQISLHVLGIMRKKHE